MDERIAYCIDAELCFAQAKFPGNDNMMGRRRSKDLSLPLAFTARGVRSTMSDSAYGPRWGLTTGRRWNNGRNWRRRLQGTR